MFSAKLNEALTSKQSFFHDRLNAVGLLVSLLLNAINWVIILGKIKPSANNILLHYNVIYGSDLVAHSWYAYGIPLLALVLLVVNFILAQRVYQKEKLAAYFLSMATIAIQVIFIVASLVLII